MRIILHFVGFGASSDSHHITSPDPSGSGMTRALSLCMRDAGMKSSDVSLEWIS